MTDDTRPAPFTWPGLATPPADTRPALQVSGERAWESGRHKPTRGADPFDKPVVKRKPGRPPKDKSAPAAPGVKTTFASKKNPFTGDPVTMKKSTQEPASAPDIAGLEICNDPVRVRTLTGNKYGPLFEKLSPGQCIKCPSDDTAKIAGALRKWLGDKTSEFLVRAVRKYPTDGKGRVWLLDAKGGKS